MVRPRLIVSRTEDKIFEEERSIVTRAPHTKYWRASVFLNSFFACDRVELYVSLTKFIMRREVRDISQTNLGTSMRATWIVTV